MTLVYFFFALLFVHINACSCLFGTFKDLYDRSSSVVRAKVVKVEPVPQFPPCPLPPRTLPCLIFPTEVRYKFRLRKVLKGCGPARQVFFGENTLPFSSCGVSLTKGKVYMLNLGTERMLARSPGTGFRLSSCNGNRLFSMLSKMQKRTLRRCSRLPKNQCMP